MKKIFTIAIAALSFNVFAQIPTAGLVGQYDFTGNANDGSANNNNGTISGATLIADRFGNSNSAYYYDGINDYIEIPNISAYNNQLYTISYWTKFSTPSTPGSGGFDVNPALISKLSASTSVTYDNWVFYEANGTPGFAYGSAGYGSSNSLFNDNNWHNIICTVDSDSVRFYYDGVQSSAVLKGPNLTFNSQPIRIGRSIATYWKAFNGIIDDILFYNRALSSVEVAQIYNNANCTPDISTGLVGQYDFTGNANDGSANNNNGTISGATLVADRFGNSNSAYYYDGINNYIEIPNISAYNNQLYTISYWTKFPTPSTPGSGGFDVNPALISKLSASTSVTYDNWVFYEANGTPGFAYGSAGYGSSNSLFNDNNWHNIICTVNSDSVRFYYDGVQSSAVLIGPNLTFNSQPIRIGRSIATYWKAFNGIIDDIRIYNRALNSCDVDNLYNMPNSITTVINETENVSSTFIYPNPTNGKINLNTTEPVNVIILNNGGEIVKSIQNNGGQIDVSNLNNGIYLLQVKNQNSAIISIYKFVKN